MGLQDTLTIKGSKLSAANGGAILTNPLATKTSPLHANGSDPGYSISGAAFGEVNKSFQLYNDGMNNVLPQPSKLDLNGKTPKRYTSNLPK
jgi:hypothetical protein